MVVMQDEFGSGGNRTRVIMPGTTSEKYLETNVEINDDFPTPSAVCFEIIIVVVLIIFVGLHF